MLEHKEWRPRDRAPGAGVRKYTIPQPMMVEYLVLTNSTRRLGEHLGSTSIPTDSNEAKVSEMRYMAWEEKNCCTYEL